MAEQVWRPRFCVRAQRSGSPWVPVRPYYEGLPSKEGRYGPDEGRRKPPGSRGESLRSDLTRRSRGGRRHSGAPEGGVPQGTRHRKVQTKK